jgi:nucleoside-diphosphate-sugar epimerase
MKIAVTGCNGRVGRPVLRHALKEGHSVVGIDQAPSAVHPQEPQFSYTQADLRDYQQVLQSLRKCDAVLHLAGIPNPLDYLVTAHNTYLQFTQASDAGLIEMPFSNVVVSWNILRSAAEVCMPHFLAVGRLTLGLLQAWHRSGLTSIKRERRCNVFRSSREQEV